MIQANELRIGNWVQCDIWDNGEIAYLQVNAIASNSIFVEHHSGAFGGYDGVPLTPEILKKCGFKNRKLNNFYFFENGNLIIEGYEADYNGLFIGGIKHLHQLQNLFFALTGKEIPIELQKDEPSVATGDAQRTEP